MSSILDEPQLQVHIRWYIRRDMPEVLAIEADSFEFPWTEKDFLYCLRQRNCIGMVAEHEDRVVGFMIYELNETRIRLLSIATAADCRRQGIGTALVAKLIRKITPQRRTAITLEVRETNLPAQLFFRRHGFRVTAIRRGVYGDDTPDDAYSMRYQVKQQGGSDE